MEPVQTQQVPYKLAEFTEYLHIHGIVWQHPTVGHIISISQETEAWAYQTLPGLYSQSVLESSFPACQAPTLPVMHSFSSLHYRP